MPLNSLIKAIDDFSAPTLDHAAEANHRIANNLTLIASLIRLQVSHLPDTPTMPVEEVRGELSDICGRIEAVGRLHRLLVHTKGQAVVDLSSYLREIGEVTVSSLVHAERVALSFDLAPECIVAPKQAVAIGLIVGEAISNSLKYAHPAGVNGKLQLACEPLDRGIVIEIADDGVGLPEGFDPMKDGATGCAVSRALATQLSAKLEFDQMPIGLCVRLTIPQPSN
ncbi:MAG: sensor histidine kinase [Methylovirgula sp.]